MKKNINLLFMGLVMLFFSCNNKPFEETECIVEGVLTIGANPCMSDPCLPGVGLWIVTESKSYVIDNYWMDSSEELCVGDITVHCGDSIRAYGISRSYYDCNGDLFSEISIDSLVLLSPLIETKDSIYTTITGSFLIAPNTEECWIDYVRVSTNCYTPNEDWSCVTICNTEICGMFLDNQHISVEAQGFVYPIFDSIRGKKRNEILIDNIVILNNNE